MPRFSDLPSDIRSRIIGTALQSVRTRPGIQAAIVIAAAAVKPKGQER